jgi:hypothetical protein
MQGRRMRNLSKDAQEKQDSWRRIGIPFAMLYLLISPQVFILLLIIAIAVRAF